MQLAGGLRPPGLRQPEPTWRCALPAAPLAACRRLAARSRGRRLGPPSPAAPRRTACLRTRWRSSGSTATSARGSSAGGCCCRARCRPPQGRPRSTSPTPPAPCCTQAGEVRVAAVAQGPGGGEATLRAAGGAPGQRGEAGAGAAAAEPPRGRRRAHLLTRCSACLPPLPARPAGGSQSHRHGPRAAAQLPRAWRGAVGGAAAEEGAPPPRGGPAPPPPPPLPLVLPPPGRSCRRAISSPHPRPSAGRPPPAPAPTQLCLRPRARPRRR